MLVLFMQLLYESLRQFMLPDNGVLEFLRLRLRE